MLLGPVPLEVSLTGHKIKLLTIRTSNGMKKPMIIVILGQTATGKSDLAVQIAKKIKGEIISADSRQVYKGLDIGTGKVPRDKFPRTSKLETRTYLHRGIPHYLLDVVSPKKKFTVVEYQKKANSAIAEILKKGKIPILCGGTGFYLDAITKGIILPEVPPNLKLRKTLSSKSAVALFEYLKKLDKNRAKNIDRHNKVRLIRAIEIAKALGKVPKMMGVKPPYKFVKIGLFLPNILLKKKIEKRVKKMLQVGLLKEIKKLKKLGVSEKRLKEFGFEYDNPTEEKVIKETFKYAKRQMTWFKKDKEIKWFQVDKIKAPLILKGG
jgi:tRNA dimethylallyltransferase